VEVVDFRDQCGGNLAVAAANRRGVCEADPGQVDRGDTSKVATGLGLLAISPGLGMEVAQPIDHALYLG
jgi:hypothetical protein